MWNWCRDMEKTWNYVPFTEAVDICDTLRKPINSSERASRIVGKKQSELFPYYGATGQVGFIDDYITNGEYVLLGEDGAPFLDAYAPKAYIISGKTWVNNHAHVLRSKTNNKFLCYYLNSFNYKGFVSGTTRLKLTQAEMKRIPVPVPPLPEQERIVARIEELFSQLDAGVETLKKTKAQLTVYRQAVLKEAFESISGAGVSNIASLCKNIVDCPHSTPKWSDEGYLCLRTTNFKRGKLDFSEKNYVTKETFNIRNARLVPMPGDVLYSREGAILGIACIIPKDTFVCLGQRMMLLRPSEKLNNRYLMYFLNSPVVTNFVASITGGSASPHVNVGDIKAFMIPCPNIAVQEKLVLEIDSRFSVCDSIEQTVDTALQRAEAMRQSILKKAFEGKL